MAVNAPLPERAARITGAERSSGAPWAQRITSVLGVPYTDGNTVDILRNGCEIFPAMIEAIDQARRTVDLVTFVYWQGDVATRFARALRDAALRGCRVRVLLDAVGARRMSDDLVDLMSNAGCDVRMFRPIADGPVPEIGRANHRTHRKILVCDGAVAFTGGVGIADEWDGDARSSDEWRDTHIRVTGPAVAGLQAGFIDNWADENDDHFDPGGEALVSLDPTGDVTATVIRGSAETGASEMWRLLLTLASGARERLRIASAYFNPDDRLVEALTGAARRGVQVQVLVPGEHADKRFVQLAGERQYRPLLEAGVEVYEYGVSMMHAKVVTVDRLVATVGSTNVNHRSTQLDEEANVILFDRRAVAQLDEHFAHDLTVSQRLDLDLWAERGRLQRLGERATALARRWM